MNLARLMEGLLSFLHSGMAFVLILLPLVVFHELGHFLFARLFGVKAEIFSVGFGPTLWSRVWSGTEFRFSLIPLGGYVKLLGEDAEAPIALEERPASLHYQAAWKRFFIFFGGPLFNFILATFIFMVILVLGEQQVASRLGRVVHGSFAEKSGLRSGDQILAINQQPLTKFEDLFIILNESANQELELLVVHPQGSSPVRLHIAPTAQEGFSIYGEAGRVGEIDGISPYPRALVVGIDDPHSPAGLAGLTTGDELVDLLEVTSGSKPTPAASEPKLNWESLEARYQAFASGSRLRLSFQKKATAVAALVETPAAPVGAVAVSVVELRKPETSLGLEADWGLFSSELFIEKVLEGSPAWLAGIMIGDRITAVGDTAVRSFAHLRALVQKSGESTRGEGAGKVLLHWQRAGREHVASILPQSTTGHDPTLKKVTQYTIGVAPWLVFAEPEWMIEQVWNPIKLVSLGFQKMVTLSWRNFLSLKKMLFGDVSVGTLGGPLMIGKIAGESLTRGWNTFLNNMAIFSIGLGVLNILPIPVLDGGHLLLLGVEVVRRKPLSVKQMEVVQAIGLVFILSLMVIAFWNDFARLLAP